MARRDSVDFSVLDAAAADDDDDGFGDAPRPRQTAPRERWHAVPVPAALPRAAVDAAWAHMPLPEDAFNLVLAHCTLATMLALARCCRAMRASVLRHDAWEAAYALAFRAGVVTPVAEMDALCIAAGPGTPYGHAGYAHFVSMLRWSTFAFEQMRSDSKAVERQARFVALRNDMPMQLLDQAFASWRVVPLRPITTHLNDMLDSGAAGCLPRKLAPAPFETCVLPRSAAALETTLERIEAEAQDRPGRGGGDDDDPTLQPARFTGRGVATTLMLPGVPLCVPRSLEWRMGLRGARPRGAPRSLVPAHADALPALLTGATCDDLDALMDDARRIEAFFCTKQQALDQPLPPPSPTSAPSSAPAPRRGRHARARVTARHPIAGEMPDTMARLEELEQQFAADISSPASRAAAAAAAAAAAKPARRRRRRPDRVIEAGRRVPSTARSRRWWFRASGLPSRVCSRAGLSATPIEVERSVILRLGAALIPGLLGMLISLQMTSTPIWWVGVTILTVACMLRLASRQPVNQVDVILSLAFLFVVTPLLMIPPFFAQRVLFALTCVVASACATSLSRYSRRLESAAIFTDVAAMYSLVPRFAFALWLGTVRPFRWVPSAWLLIAPLAVLVVVYQPSLRAVGAVGHLADRCLPRRRGVLLVRLLWALSLASLAAGLYAWLYAPLVPADEATELGEVLELSSELSVVAAQMAEKALEELASP